MSTESSPLVAALRRGLIVLAALSVLATAAELAMIRHWKTVVQLIPWFVLGVLAAGIVLLVIRPTRGSILALRVLAVVVFAATAYGVFEHVQANYDAGPLDFRYSAKWATMSSTSRVWAAATESVGPAPTLAPAVLAEAAFCLALATLGHPGLSKVGGTAPPAPTERDVTPVRP